MAQVCLSGVSYTYPGFVVPSLVDVDLLIEDGEFVSVLGPSGAGKSTMLRLLIGLAQPSSGSILIGGHNVTHSPPNQRDVATIGANHPLYPHMTVEENIAFALDMAGIPASIVAARVNDVIGILDLGALRGRYPKRLSKGERQSVFMARAMAKPNDVLVLDEPLSDLDHDDRRRARTQLGILQRRSKTTTIYVTQDQTEAMSLSDRIAIIDQGRVQQVMKPLELYHNPATLSVAQFFGSPPMNTLTAVRVEDGARVGDLVVPVPSSVPTRIGAPLVIGARAEEIHLLPRGAAVEVSYVDNTGMDAFVYGWIGTGDQRQRIVVRCQSRVAPRARETVFVDIMADDHVLFFDPLTGRRL